MNGNIGKNKLEEIISALIKKSVGYSDEEHIEEYVIEDGVETLVKKRITKKFVPPDLSATKLLLEYFNQASNTSYEDMTDDELDAEVERLYDEYKKIKTKVQIETEEK